MRRDTPARVSRPPATLTNLVNRPGGIPRDLAIARSMEKLEAQRGPAQDAILTAIARLEAISKQNLSMEAMRELRRVTDQLIALAATFDMEALASAGKRLCDLTADPGAVAGFHRDAIAVHVRALRLFASPAKLSATSVDDMMRALDDVLAHFDIHPPVP